MWIVWLTFEFTWVSSKAVIAFFTALVSLPPLDLIPALSYCSFELISDIEKYSNCIFAQMLIPAHTCCPSNKCFLFFLYPLLFPCIGKIVNIFHHCPLAFDMEGQFCSCGCQNNRYCVFKYLGASKILYKSEIWKSHFIWMVPRGISQLSYLTTPFSKTWQLFSIQRYAFDTYFIIAHNMQVAHSMSPCVCNGAALQNLALLYTINLYAGEYSYIYCRCRLDIT